MSYIGVDLGTNSIRAALFDGQLAGKTSRYPLAISYPEKSAALQDPQMWYSGVVSCIREAASGLGQNVEAISFSMQGGCLVPVDKFGNPLSQAVSWLDARAGEQAARLLKARTPEQWAEITGMVPDQNSFLCHLMWLKENRPEIFAQADRFLTASDYINLKLTGNAATDPTNAQMTGMLDITTGKWDEFSLEAAGIDQSKLPGILPTGAVVGTMSANAARDAGLDGKTLVRNGAHDQYACALGCGAVNPKDAMLSCGTAWVMLTAMEKLPANADTALAVGFHAVPDRYGAFYSVSAGCQTLNWVADITGLGSSFAQTDSICEKRLLSREDVFMYPFLAGCTPLDGGRTGRGAFAGLSLDVDKYDLALSAMEAVVFEIVRALPVFTRSGVPVESLKMVGGAARSELWAQILAAATGLKVYRSPNHESALTGAALLSGAKLSAFTQAQLTEVQVSHAVREYYAEKYTRYIAGLPHAFSVYEETARAKK